MKRVFPAPASAGYALAVGQALPLRQRCLALRRQKNGP